MSSIPSKIRLIATCAFGLEAVVKRELMALGFKDFFGADGRVEFDGALDDIPVLNLWLRVADRVLVKVGGFAAADFGRLFDGTYEVPWESWILPEARITVTGKCVRSKLMSVRSCQSIVKKAVLRRLEERLKVSSFPETGAEFTIHVSVLKDEVLLTLDTSGAGLHKRGYRVGSGEVPLRENLAAALVLLSFWDKDRILIDPMCGAGTILIEAAMIARNMAPGMNREFAAEHWPCIPAVAWQQARQEAARAVVNLGALRISGYDIDPERIRDSRANARKAKVEKDIVFEVKDIKDLWINDPYGIVISNPPYGIKLGGLKELTLIYVLLHNMFRNKTGWSLYILTADNRFPDFFKRARPDKVRKLFNGTIEANYYQYYGERPPLCKSPGREAQV
jgi:putative N6-adenine-specific DNA methylase